MKFVIKDIERSQKWIEIFKIIKYLNSYTTICCQDENLFIQIMDDSHVCLLNININKNWFEHYESNSETISFYSNIMVKILQLYVPNTTMTFEIVEERLNITFQYEDKREKIFELNLVDIDKDILNSESIEGSVEFQMNTKSFDKYITEMLLFGDSMEFICYQDNLYMKSSGDEGNYTLKIPHELLDELIVEDDLELRSRISLKYLYYLTKSHNVFKQIKLKIQSNCPFHIEIDEPLFKLQYYIAPKINDDEEEGRDDFSEFQDEDYNNLENSIM